MKFKISNKFIGDIKSFLSGTGDREARSDGYMKLSIMLLCAILFVSLGEDSFKKPLSVIGRVIADATGTTNLVVDATNSTPIVVGPIVETNSTPEVTNNFVFLPTEPTNTVEEIKPIIVFDPQPTNEDESVSFVPTTLFDDKLKEIGVNSLWQKVILTKIQISKDKKKILKTLGLTEEEFDDIMSK